jgi:hypothetical protein
MHMHMKVLPKSEKGDANFLEKHEVRENVLTLHSGYENASDTERVQYTKW